MLKKTLFAMAAVATISGGAMALQAAPAQAAPAEAFQGKVTEAHYRGRGWRHRHHRRCYYVRKRVRGHYGWHWKRVRVCAPRRWHRRYH